MTTPRLFFAGLVFSVLIGIPTLLAKDKVELKIDPSPVTEGGKPGVVSSYADVVEPAQKALVSVYSTKIVRTRVPVHPMFRQLFGEAPEQQQEQKGLGSGVLISTDGYILTNNHVVEGADKLKVLLSDDREYVAKVIGADDKTDVAVIKIEAEKLACITLADSDKLRIGDVVFALGNPLDVGQTVTMGIVSAVGRSNLELLDEGRGYESFIQTDASINMGNSGGALIDAKGRLIGINTAILSPSRGSIGIGFAIPANLAASVMHSMVENDGVVRRGMLGVRGDSLSGYPELAETLGLRKEQKGVVVQQLLPEDGPAAKAGIKREDVIVSINEKPVNSLQDLRFIVSQLAPGSEAKIRYIREGKERSVEVTLGSLDLDAEGSELFPGIKVSPLTEELRKQLELDRGVEGLVVEEVADNSPLRDRLVPGVVILEINRIPVLTLQKAREAIAKRERGRNILLYVNYHGSLRYIPLPPQ